MKNSAEWLSLLADEDYVNKVIDNARALGAYHRDQSCIGAIEREVGGYGNDPERVFPAMERFFDRKKIDEILAAEQGAFRTTPTYASKFQGYSTGSQTAMALARSRNFITLLIATDPYLLRVGKKRKVGDHRSISFAGTPGSLRILDGTLKARLWSLKPFNDADDFASFDRVAEPGAPFELRAGETCRMSSFETLEYLPNDGPALMLITQMSDGEAPLAVTCDADSGCIRSTQAIGQAPSRLQMLASLLRLFGRTDAWEAIRDLLEHERHYVRWHAMRELLAIDPRRALPDLVRLMENDPQPAVRRSAKAALAIVNAHLEDSRAA